MLQQLFPALRAMVLLHRSNWIDLSGRSHGFVPSFCSRARRMEVLSKETAKSLVRPFWGRTSANRSISIHDLPRLGTTGMTRPRPVDRI